MLKPKHSFSVYILSYCLWVVVISNWLLDESS